MKEIYEKPILEPSFIKKKGLKEKKLPKTKSKRP